MRNLIAALPLVVAVAAGGCREARHSTPSTQGGPAAMTTGTLYEFTLPDIDGTSKSLGDFRGRVLLLVNVASKCGFTPQYTPLESLYEKFHARGFDLLAFPANNFGAQEPGTNEEIKAFCAEHYRVSFPLFGKISVKGDDIHPLYRYLTTAAGVDGEVKWNFAKFLVDRHGTVVARYASSTDPFDPVLVARIEELLAAH